jgi:two-component system, sensor histidine kinase
VSADAAVVGDATVASDHAQMALFVERLPIGAVHVQDGRLIMNAAAERLIGYPRERIVTLEDWFATLYGEAAAELQAKYEALRAERFTRTTHGKIRRGDGVERLLEFRACTDTGGETWIFDDITERAAFDQGLIEAKQAAEAANRAKSEFLANMSHELRTPLNGVLTMAQLMARGELEASQREKLDIIRASGQELLHVINDILDFSKIEAGKLDLESIDFDPTKVLEAMLAGFAAVAERQQIELHLEVAANARGLRTGDPTRLRQIVNNYVSNALKFTAEGSVRIRIAGDGAEGREGLIIAVRDTGVGVPASKMPLLFQKFSQVDASTTRQFGGTGLGLAICRELAALMGGRVWADSEVGVGSTFYCALGLPYAGEAVQAETRDDVFDDFAAMDETGADPAPPLRILAAEDNRTNQVVLSTIMEVFGFELTLVENGREAVEAWSAGGFDLVLMDVQMPEMDGVTATRLIRKAELRSNLPRTPIIALSANAFSHQINEYAAAGMDAHVAKPIELATLQAVIEQVLSEDEPERLYA